MSLIYRGQKAQASDVVNTIDIARQGKFLGASFTFRAPQQSIRYTEKSMQYRGVIY